MLKQTTQRRRRLRNGKFPECFREEIESTRSDFFRIGDTGRVLYQILLYGKLPSDLNACEAALRIAAEVVCGWIRELPSSNLSTAEFAHRCSDSSRSVVEHARNWADSLLRRPPPQRRRSRDKDIFASRFITEVRNAAVQALAALNAAAAEPLRPAGGATYPQGRHQRSLFRSEA